MVTPGNTSNSSYAASVFAIISGFTFNEWVALIGLFLAVATFGVNWFYKHKHYMLAVKGLEYDEHNQH